jgi:cytochrome c oxidase cbb3-type subunit 2
MMRWSKSALFLFPFLLLATAAPLLAAGGVEPRRPDPTDWPGDLLWMIGPRDGRALKPAPRPSAALRERGRIIYRVGCAKCHGDEGDGRGPLANGQTVRPTDFTRGVFKVRSTPSGTLPTDLDLFATITRGMHGTPMHPWRQLDELDRWGLVLHLKSFSPRFGSERPGRPVGVPIAPRETGGLQDRGERLYVQLRCATCHGDQGAGDGPARESLRLRGDRAMRIRDFTRGRFIRGTDMEDIYLTLRVGIEGTPMAAYEQLKDDELWALAAYVRLLVREQPLFRLPPAGDRPAAPNGR